MKNPWVTSFFVAFFISIAAACPTIGKILEVYSAGYMVTDATMGSLTMHFLTNLVIYTLLARFVIWIISQVRRGSITKTGSIIKTIESQQKSDTALEALRMRLARGEITEEQYKSIRETLKD